MNYYDFFGKIVGVFPLFLSVVLNLDFLLEWLATQDEGEPSLTCYNR